MTANSSPTKKRGKALDVLEKHISQQNKKPKNNQYGALSSMFQTITDSVRLPAPVSQPRPRIISSSPPRRAEQTSGNRQSPIPKSPDHPSQRSSPKKSVAFSDQIDSSPPPASLHSSPYRSSQNLPSKPILKFTLPPVRTPSPRRKNNQSGFNNRLTIDQGGDDSDSDPMSLSYWVSGEVHGLGDIKSTTEFKGVLTGGLYFLSSDIPEAKKRYFEIYATFNNIMPIFTSPNYSEVKDKKVQILAQNMNVILATCIPHLTGIQEELLSSLKKDPFTSRIYVQIVRFFNALFSNFKLVKICESNQSFQTALQKVVESFTEAIQHQNSNKVMITAQLALLRDEQCGIKRLTPLKVKNFVKALANMKKISSSNLTCEKLLLLKIFLAKYPEEMLETIDIWLPTEVLSRLLTEEEFYSLKIANNCVSILLDLLKRCLTDRNSQKVLHVLNQINTKVLLSASYEGNRTLTQLQTKEHDLELLLRKRVIYLIEERDEPKLAMDLWLALVGLLFNSESEISSLCSERGRLWLNLNLRYQTSNSPKSKKLALKSWRIVTYMICSKSLADIKESQKLIVILLEPFFISSKGFCQESDYENVIYVLNGLLYSILCNHHKEQFAYNLEFILSPLINTTLVGQSSLKIREAALDILLRLVSQSSPIQTQKREFNALKVVTSLGVEAADFVPFSSTILNRNWFSLISIVQKCKQTSQPEIYDLSFTLLLSVIERIPQRAIDDTTRDSCCAALLSEVDHTTHRPRLRITEALTSLLRTFKDLMFQTSPCVDKLCLEITAATQAGELDCIDVLKTVLRETRNILSYLEVYNFFLRLEDTRINDFIYNSINSKILSPKMSPQAFEAFIDIVNTYSSTEIIQVFLDTSEKGNFDLRKASKIDLSSWDFDCMVRYFTMCLQREGYSIDGGFVSQFSSSLNQRNRLATELRKSLGAENYVHFVIKLLENEKSIDPYGPNDQWMLSLISCFSKDDYSRLQKFFTDLREEIQLMLIIGAQNNDESLYFSFYFIQTLLPNKQQAADFIKAGCDRALYEILEKCFQKKLLPLLNQCVAFATENDASCLVEKFRTAYGLEFLGSLESSTLANIMNQMTSENDAIIDIFKFVLEHKPADYVLGLIEMIWAQNQLLTLNCCREHIVSFLLREGIRSDEGGRKKVLAIFENASEVLIFQHKKLLAEFMRTLISKLPARKGDFVYELLSYICKDEKFKLKGYDNLLEKINLELALTSDTYQNEKKRDTRRYQFYSAPQTPPNKTSGANENTASSPNLLSEKAVGTKDSSTSDSNSSAYRSSSNSNQQRATKKSTTAIYGAETSHTSDAILNAQKQSDAGNKDQHRQEKRRMVGPDGTDSALEFISPSGGKICSLNECGSTSRENKKSRQALNIESTETWQDEQETAVPKVVLSKPQTSCSKRVLSKFSAEGGRIKNIEKSEAVTSNNEAIAVEALTLSKKRKRNTAEAPARSVSKKPLESERKPSQDNVISETTAHYEEALLEPASSSVSLKKDGQTLDGDKEAATINKAGAMVMNKQSLGRELVTKHGNESRGADLSSATGITNAPPNAESLVKIPIFNSRKVMSKNESKQLLGRKAKPNEGPLANTDFKENPRGYSDPETMTRKGLNDSVYAACEDKKLKVILQIMREFGVNEFSQLTDAQKQFVRQEMIKFLSKSNSC
ncbi:LAQU0S02e06150g1_1 [Lachancea quebecensis]|uniref:LAQU0S02e06150g1_1 n=1 Tax=Lachancea quebecensis TaxID=1654605 RepID=A0A0P1KNF6_9SACH|nr:LAQU0S02e06150g1_1 [Lachancea quebecensis]